jgi:putative transposase
MKKSKFSEEQIAFALRMAETGTRVAEVCRKFGITEQTFYRWKRKYGGLGVSELRRLKQLEEENRRLKRMVADLSLDKQMLQDVLSKKLWLISHLVDNFKHILSDNTLILKKLIIMKYQPISSFYSFRDTNFAW